MTSCMCINFLFSEAQKTPKDTEWFGKHSLDFATRVWIGHFSSLQWFVFDVYRAAAWICPCSGVWQCAAKSNCSTLHSDECFLRRSSEVMGKPRLLERLPLSSSSDSDSGTGSCCTFDVCSAVFFLKEVCQSKGKPFRRSFKNDLCDRQWERFTALTWISFFVFGFRHSWRSARCQSREVEPNSRKS